MSDEVYEEPEPLKFQDIEKQMKRIKENSTYGIVAESYSGGFIDKNNKE